MMRMHQVEAIDIPAGGEVTVEPGGLHMMFINLAAPLTQGQDVAASLLFDKAGEVPVTLLDHGPSAMKKMKMKRGH